MSPSLYQRRATLDELTGYRRKLEEMLPVDAVRQRERELYAAKESAGEKAVRLYERLGPYPSRQIDRFYQDWRESTDEYLEIDSACGEAWSRFDEAVDRWRSAYNAWKVDDRNRLHLCSVLTVKQLGKEGEIRFRVISSRSYRLRDCRLVDFMARRAKNLRTSILRKLAAIVEALREHSRLALDQALAELLSGVLGLVVLAAEALDLVRPELTPRVLSAGGILGLFVPRC